MEKKMLFIIPPYLSINSYKEQNDVNVKAPVFTIPYGVLSIASYVNRNVLESIDIEILDLNIFAYQYRNKDIILELEGLILSKVKAFSPDFVAISALFNTCYSYLGFITETIRSVAKESFIFIGGGLATNLYEDILASFKEIDAVCYGEGEIPIYELLSASDVYNILDNGGAWITRDSLSKLKKPKYKFIENLDEIPIFDYDLIELGNYTGRALDKRFGTKPFIEFSIHTSRGCPFNCVFCANSKVHGKRVRFMSVERVMEEVRVLVEKHKMEILLIEDDHFLADKQRAKEILEGLSQFDIRIEFPNGMAVYAIDSEIGHLLQAAGATTISLAVESGSDFVLKNIIHKPLKKDMIKKAVRILKENDICVHAFIVIGLPGETEAHRTETMDMIIDVGFDWVYIFSAIPIVGSELYEICKKNNYLVSSDFIDNLNNKGNIRAPGIDPEYIEEKAYLMNLEANFVKNSNIRILNYERALQYFQPISEKYPEHAFAKYYIAKAYEALNYDSDKIEIEKEKFNRIINENEMWNRYAKYFSIS